MAIQDTTILAQQMIKHGLVSESQLQEAFDEVGVRTVEPEVLLRVLERKGVLTPYESSKLLKGDTDGYIVGGYRIRYKNGSGSFGRVYRAEDQQTGRIVAVKILRRRWTEDKHTIDLFLREGKLGLRLSHENIVEVLAVNRDPLSGQYYIVMEFIEGNNLRDFLAGRGGKLEPSLAMRFMEGAASALVHAYKTGVTHRDMKLTNILISAQEKVKLVDFGLAGIFTRTGLEISSNEKMDRTVDYAGLEKCTRVTPGDTRSDIYFLGCVLFEMLTGRSPLALSKDPRMRMDCRRFETVLPMKPEELKGPAPTSIFRLVEKMMYLDPKRRFQTPNQLLEAVRDVNKGDEPVSKAGKRTVYVVETHKKFQDAFRTHLDKKGYRVLLASDPARAYEKFIDVPYDAIIMDASTMKNGSESGEEARYTFERIMKDAEMQGVDCAGILILSEEQKQWKEDVPQFPSGKVFVQPVRFSQVIETLKQLLAQN
jgi:serine/threonine protein kinase